MATLRGHHLKPPESHRQTTRPSLPIDTDRPDGARPLGRFLGTALSRWHPASVPRQGRTVLDRRRSPYGYDLRSRLSGTADVRSGKLRDAEVVPPACQIARPAGHPGGQVRSLDPHRPAPELPQPTPEAAYRPLELLVRAAQRLLPQTPPHGHTDVDNPIVALDVARKEPRHQDGYRIRSRGASGGRGARWGAQPLRRAVRPVEQIRTPDPISAGQPTRRRMATTAPECMTRTGYGSAPQYLRSCHERARWCRFRGARARTLDTSARPRPRKRSPLVIGGGHIGSCQGEGRGFESRRPLNREAHVSAGFGRR